jgi:hypothetical protein
VVDEGKYIDDANDGDNHDEHDNDGGNGNEGYLFDDEDNRD